MRKYLLICALMMTGPAMADPVQVITKMSCAQVQALVQSNGSVVLRWQSPGGRPLYGRYVSDRRFCRPGEVIQIGSVPASDKTCNVRRCILRVPSF